MKLAIYPCIEYVVRAVSNKIKYKILIRLIKEESYIVNTYERFIMRTFPLVVYHADGFIHFLSWT